jgi:hypothetical protein
VQTNLVPLFSDEATFFREGLKAVSGDEKGCLDIVFIEEL